MVASGKIDLRRIVSHQFDFQDVQLAFENSLNDRQDVIKAVIKL